MIYFILLISLLLGVAKNIISKAGNNYFSDLKNLMIVNLVTSIFGTTIFGIGRLDFSIILNIRFTIIAFLYGLFTLASQTFLIIAVKSGKVSICSLIYSSCFLIPTFYSALFFGEKFSYMKVIGIIILILSLVFVSLVGETSKTEINKKYIVFALSAMVSAGCIGILQKYYSGLFGGKNLNEYLATSFFCMLIISMLALIIIKDKANKTQNAKCFYMLLISMAVSIVVANKMNIYLVAHLPGIIYFPVINGGCILLSTVFSALFFKEKISVLTKVAISVGVLGIILIAL